MGWPPTAEERAAAKMRDAAFLVALRARVMRRRVERLLADDAKRTPQPSLRLAPETGAKFPCNSAN